MIFIVIKESRQHHIYFFFFSNKNKKRGLEKVKMPASESVRAYPGNSITLSFFLSFSTVVYEKEIN